MRSTPDEDRTVTPTKEQLERELHDAYAVWSELHLRETGESLMPESRRAIERCRVVADIGIELGYWKAPPGWWVLGCARRETRAHEWGAP